MKLDYREAFVNSQFKRVKKIKTLGSNVIFKLIKMDVVKIADFNIVTTDTIQAKLDRLKHKNSSVPSVSNFVNESNIDMNYLIENIGDYERIEKFPMMIISKGDDVQQ